MPTPSRLDAHTRRAVAVDAAVDPRSVDRYVRGERLRPTTAERIRRALAARSIVVATPANDSPPNPEPRTAA